MKPLTENLYRDVGDESSPAEKAMFHVIYTLTDWDEADMLVDPPAVRALLDKIELALWRAQR